MSSSDVPAELVDVAEAAPADFRQMYTWRGVAGNRLEQTRVQVNGQRLKASGYIISAATDEHEAFSASYDLLTNEHGVTRRLSITVTKVSGDTQISLTRDGERNWLVQTPQGVQRGEFGGAEDIDLALSPFFNALPIRRHALHRASGELTIPVAYVYLPSETVEATTMQYHASAAGIAVMSPVASSTLTVDADGFVIDYPGLAERV